MQVLKIKHCWQTATMQSCWIMCTIGGLGRYSGRYIGRLSTDYRPIVGRQSVDYRPTVDRYSGRLTADSLPLCRSTIGRCIGRYVAINCRPTIGQESDKCRPSIGLVSAKCRPSIGLVSAKYRPSIGKVSAEYRSSICSLTNLYIALMK